MNLKEQNYLTKLLEKYSKKSSSKKMRYALLENAFSNIDIIKGIEVLLEKNITMSKITKKFEIEFAKFIGSKFALMVNSGSSANLLAIFALINPKKNSFLKRGDECLIPSLCWSTSLWPIVQAGLKPKFVDVDVDTLNISMKSLEKQTTKKTKVLMAVHVLGNSANMEKLNAFTKQRKIYLVEDTCESLGSKFKEKYLGTFGDFGTYSFYYSHQITSGEGGMIVCNNRKDYEIIYSLRSHGWDRGLKRKNKAFNFINSGFNLRPTDVTAAIGYNQFKRLNKFMKIRSSNRSKIINTLTNSPNWKEQFTFINQITNLEPSWFGLPMLINRKFLSKKKRYLIFLNSKGIETRPIISGNFMNQPSVKLYGLNKAPSNFKGAQEIEDRGFFIGIHTTEISEFDLRFLEKNLLSIDAI